MQTEELWGANTSKQEQKSEKTFSQSRQSNIPEHTKIVKMTP